MNNNGVNSTNMLNQTANASVQGQPVVQPGVSSGTVSQPQVPGNSTTVPSSQTSTTLVQPGVQSGSVPPASPVVNGNTVQPNRDDQSPKKKKSFFARFFFLIALCLGGYVVFLTMQQQQLELQLKQECSPVSTTKGTKQLDINSTIVQDLYGKVSTNIREDLVSIELTDEMKVYLAYRQIPNKKIYESNCNLFSDVAMEPYTCMENTTFMPTAFKEQTLDIELKKLFGSKTNIAPMNVQLGDGCLGGYQYIKERGEYVEGYCSQKETTSFRATKKLVSATSNQSTIVLREEVKYYEAEKQNLPENLRDGIYVYTFQLDTNYNYVYVSKTFEE